MDNWNDKKFATDWDNDSAVNNPIRNLLLSLLVSIIEDNYQPGDKILDLGSGSGQVEKLIFEKLPNAEITGVDGSQVMIDLAKEKLANKPLTFLHHDLNRINDLKLGEEKFKFVITSFALHELENKKEIFQFIQKTLAPNGIYILVDRFKIEIESMSEVYRSHWRWQSENLNKTNWSDWKEAFEEYTKKMAGKEDSPDAVEDQLAWLREVGLSAACLQLQFDRGLIAAIKR